MREKKEMMAEEVDEDVEGKDKEKDKKGQRWRRIRKKRWRLMWMLRKR